MLAVEMGFPVVAADSGWPVVNGDETAKSIQARLDKMLQDSCTAYILVQWELCYVASLQSTPCARRSQRTSLFVISLYVLRSISYSKPVLLVFLPPLI